MPKPVCVACKRFYRPERNGVFTMEQMPQFNGAESGTAAEQDWMPYQIWRADLWKCEGCGHEIVAGFAPFPISEHYMPDFAKWMALVSVTVNDC